MFNPLGPQKFSSFTLFMFVFFFVFCFFCSFFPPQQQTTKAWLWHFFLTPLDPLFFPFDFFSTPIGLETKRHKTLGKVPERVFFPPRYTMNLIPCFLGVTPAPFSLFSHLFFLFLFSQGYPHGRGYPPPLAPPTEIGDPPISFDVVLIVETTSSPSREPTPKKLLLSLPPQSTAPSFVCSDFPHF